MAATISILLSAIAVVVSIAAVVQSRRSARAAEQQAVVSEQALALERGRFHLDAAPNFETALESPSDGSKGWGVRVTCSGRMNSYEVDLEIIRDTEAVPAFIYIYGERGQLQALGHNAYKRIGLAPFSPGESRVITAQPEASGGHGREVGLRFIARSPDLPDAAWESIRSITIPPKPAIY